MFRLRQRWAFARHIPLRQIAARLALELQRRISLRTRPRLGPPLPVSPTPPLPLFPSRTGMIAIEPRGGRFTFLGRTVEMGETIDWSAPGPGTANQLWRMNLHYMEYLEALGADQGLPLMRQWIASNPPWQPGYWRDTWNSYTLSLRIVVWMQCLAAWQADPADPGVARIHASLAAQLHFLERNLERDIGGNHLIKNLKALAWGSAFFAGQAAARWREKAIVLLAAELPRQILNDGVHYERSPSYHAQVFADLIETRHALGGDPLAGALDRALDRIAMATDCLAHPDGLPAQFNDAGLTMAYAPAACLEAYTAVTGRSSAAGPGSFAFRAAGYFGMHNPALSLIVDMGRIGPDDLPAHAHGDIGSFELSVAGERMIVDQGVFEYVPGEKRALSRSAASHNGLALAGHEPADFFGAFRCGRRPEVAVTRHIANPGGFLLEGSHTGYAHLPGRPIAFRHIEAEPERILIADRLVCSQWRPAAVCLLLHPDCAVQLDGPVAIVTRGDARLAITASQPLAAEPAIWWPDMGQEIETTRLRLTLPPSCLESSLELVATPPSAPEIP